MPPEWSVSELRPNDTTRQSVVFKDLFGKPVVARFDQPDSSSDGGAILLKACDERLGLTEALTRCLHDGRQQSKVEHSVHDLIRQRVYGIACGYEDCNDAARIGEDPVHKMLVDRDPVDAERRTDFLQRGGCPVRGPVVPDEGHDL